MTGLHFPRLSLCVPVTLDIMKLISLHCTRTLSHFLSLFQLHDFIIFLSQTRRDEARMKWNKVKVAQSCTTHSPWDSPGQNTGVGSLSLLQGIFPTQELNLGLPHCRRILYQLSHKGSLTILQWVAYPFSSRSPWPRNQTACTAGGF